MQRIVTRMTVRDAEMLWLAARMPTDQYLLYCFDAAAAVDTAVRYAVADTAGLLRRCAGIADLRVRVAPVPGDLDYPYWVPMPVTPGHLVEADVGDWASVCARVAGLLTTPVDPTVESVAAAPVPRRRGRAGRCRNCCGAADLARARRRHPRHRDRAGAVRGVGSQPTVAGAAVSGLGSGRGGACCGYLC